MIAVPDVMARVAAAECTAHCLARASGDIHPADWMVKQD
jgi:hypothetical protein